MPTTNLGRVRPIYRGLYSAATAYRPLDFVTFNGVTYFCIANTTDNAPTNAAFWQTVTAGGLADFGVTATTAQLNVLTGIPALGGNGSRFLRGNAGATALEYRTPAQVRSDLSINGIGSETATTITNLNTLTVAGEYYVEASSVGAPDTDIYLVKHYAANSTSAAFQEAFRFSDSARFWRRELNGTWGAWQQVQPALGFTPVEQGGGSYMLTNKVRIGWDAGGGTGMMRLQVDAQQLGSIVYNQSAINTIANGQMFAPGNAPLYAARAWVNFDGTNGAIRASGNIASVVRNGVGDYTINFATAMPDANYSVAGIAKRSGLNEPGVLIPQSYTSAAVRVFTGSGSFALTDSDIVNIAIFR